MFDIGWTELLVIAVVLIVVVGPKDLPPMLRAFGKMTQRARKVAGDFRAQFDEALREAELDDVRQTLSDAQKLNPVNSLREAMNPLRQMGNEIKADLQKATVAPENKTEVPPAAASTPTPSMSLPETPPLVPAPAQPEPVAAAAIVQAETVAAKPKAPRKPRAKAADKAAFAIAAPVEKPKRTTAVRKPAAPKTPVQMKKKDEA
ncbi:Sec-independent protein translocase protein TatB [Rhizobium leguminosarum]|uniref:Sec-independent protein translocase protein TatB n=1 Tax=Rhizobium leguminosarum TaxID=384 RepID=UPI001AE2FB25|nr:Sec-independent protein translocase protein TatB [Rhizobium leguminosarum]MBP2446126.1 sec-independent protein translocase protein TatB [Rhizobium leguminosarum]